ncbi:hypothetical protein M3J09_011303 [Ascochyta lentis]
MGDLFGCLFERRLSLEHLHGAIRTHAHHAWRSRCLEFPNLTSRLANCYTSI